MQILPWLHIVGSGQLGLSSPWDCHLYALQGEEGILLIDAGSGLSNDRVIHHLREAFGPRMAKGTILVTHRHADHAAGATALSQQLGDWTVVTSLQTEPFLTRGQRENSGYPTELNYLPCPIGRTFGDGDQLTVEGFSIKAIRVRGHSDDSYVFLVNERMLFTADVVFYGGVLGLINTPDSNLAHYCQDLPRLSGLEITGLFPSHGLFTIENGQRHIDAALGELRKGFVPRMIGQGDLIF